MKVLIILLALMVGIMQCKDLPNEVGYPDGYRNWTHVKSLELKANHPLFASFGGIHHIYANEIALKAMQEKSTYPDGSVLIFDLLEVKSDDSATAEGNRKVLGVMLKNSKAFSATKGWGFEGFKGNTKERLVSGKHESCFGCHSGQEKKDFTFSEYRD